MADPASKLERDLPRREVPDGACTALLDRMFQAMGFSPETSGIVAHHLVDTSLCGIESHGVMRVLEYASQVRKGYLTPGGATSVRRDGSGVLRAEGGGSLGIPTMLAAYEAAMEEASERGISALSIREVGHTGRHGAFAEHAAEQGFLTICLGGGNRHIWRQVAPHGGARGMLPTNPWCVGIPGGARGPVVMDFATSMIAGGWIYAARSAGAKLPEGCIIDKHGNPTRDPEAYFEGGAILPAGAQKGYALALVAELVGEAMLGPATTECNWLLIALRTDSFRAPSAMHSAAEDILSELRDCPPAPGFAQVEIPGERERAHRVASDGIVAIPERTWTQIRDLARELGVPIPDLGGNA